MTQVQPVFWTDPPHDSGPLTVATDQQSATALTRISRAPLWATQYRIVLFTLDVSAVIIAVTAGFDLHFGSLDTSGHGRYYFALAAGLVCAWLVMLAHYGCFEIRHLASGAEEAKRVLRASVALLVVWSVVGYAFQIPLARGLVIGVIPLGAVILLLLRAAARQFVNDRREQGCWVHRIVAVGTTDSVENLLTVTERARGAGLQVVGVCVEDAEVGTELRPGVPVLGGVLDAARHASEVDADVVAVTGSGLGPTGVRELGWQLEGTHRGLVIAPALTEIAGTRMHVSPVEGLPLMWLDRPQLGRLDRLAKRLLDLGAGLLLLVLLAPVFAFAATAIKCTSRGPVFFRQRRLGVNGTEFDILKFRTMYTGAEGRRDEILALNEQDGGGVLFKIRTDPRITSAGKLLRRLSIDEMPQLLQVLSGTMSLVGPRPLAVQDSIYTGSARRRLLVRPGLTGLWQISGRSDISWDDAVRLDLYYVENWSLGLDVSILFRTVLAVLGRKGAY